MNTFRCFHLTEACIQTMTKTLHILHFYCVCITQHHTAFRLLQRAVMTEYTEGLRQLGGLQFHSCNAKLPLSLISYILVSSPCQKCDCCRPCYRKSRQDVCVFCLLGFSERPIFGSLSSKQTRRAPVSQWFLVRLECSCCCRDCASPPRASCGFGFLVAVVVCAVVLHLVVL